MLLLLMACSLFGEAQSPITIDSAEIEEHDDNISVPAMPQPPVELDIHIFISSEHNKAEIIDEGPGCPGEDYEEVIRLPIDGLEEAIEIEEDTICVGCEEESLQDEPDEPVSIEVKINPLTGEIQYVIKDLEIEL